MSLTLLIGLGLLVLTVAIQSVAAVGIISFLRSMAQKGYAGASFLHNTFILQAIVLALLAAHALQIILWGLLFLAAGEFHSIGPAIYRSALDYTTLGYGGIVMSPQLRILEPLEAMNGVLMFGLSTAIMFEVLRYLERKRRGVSAGTSTR